MDIERIIATDMDATFLDHNLDYDRSRFASLHRELVARRYRFVVASGNQYYQLRGLFARYPDVIYVSENGALVRDADQVYFKQNFAATDARYIMTALIEYHDVEWAACGEASAYVLRSATPEYVTSMRRYYHRIVVINDLDEIPEPILKFTTRCSGNETQHYLKEYNTRFLRMGEAVSSHSGDIDILQPGINKARGLTELCAVLGVCLADVVAFGNGRNDVEMLRTVGDGVAVANATPEVLAVADHTTESATEQGVLNYLEAMLRGEDVRAEA